MEPIEWIMLAIIVIMIIAAAVMMLTMKKPKLPGAEAFQGPTIEIGTPIPVLFGPRRIKNIICTWYGHVQIIMVSPEMQGKK